MTIPRLNDYADDRDYTDPFGIPACTIVGMPEPLRLPARPVALPAAASYAARYPPELDDAVVVDVDQLWPWGGGMVEVAR